MRILQIDLDDTVFDFSGAFYSLPESERWDEHENKNVPVNFFRNLEPIEGAVEAIHKLSSLYDVYFLSTPQCHNSNSWSEKRESLRIHFPTFEKRLTLTHRKDLIKGDFLIDDRTVNGVAEFEGEHIHFGSSRFPDWSSVVYYLASLKTQKQSAVKAKEVLSGILSSLPKAKRSAGLRR